MGNITSTDSVAAAIFSQHPRAERSDPTAASALGSAHETIVSAVNAADKQFGAESGRSADELAQTVQTQTVKDTVDELNRSSLVRSTSLQFEFDEKGEPPVVRVIDKSNGEEIRQIPSEVVQKIAKAIEDYVDNKESSSGILLDQQV